MKLLFYVTIRAACPINWVACSTPKPTPAIRTLNVKEIIQNIRYDTVDKHVIKSWRDGQFNLTHGTETKNKRENQIKNRVAQMKRCKQKSVEEEVKIPGVGFVKEVGFKPGVKDIRSYRCTKRWIRKGRSDGWRSRWVGNEGTGARMRFTKRQRKLIPDTR